MIFGDSSFFVAFADKKDRRHEDAVRLRPSLTGTMVVSEPVVAESATILGSRGGGRAGATVIEYFRDSCDIVLIA